MAPRRLFPQLSLFLASETRDQKSLQVLDGGKDLIGTSEHPSAEEVVRARADQINRYALAVAYGQLGCGSAALSFRGSPITNQVIRFVLDQVEIERDDLANHATKTVEVRRLPFAKVQGFVVREIFFLVLGRIVNAVAQLVSQERRKLLPPESSAVIGKFYRAREVSQHRVGRETLARGR